MKQTIVVYGVGGYDPSKPNNNIVDERVIDVPDPEPTESDAARVLRKVVADDKVRAGELSDEDVRNLSPLYDPWRPGGTYKAGDLRSWDGTVIECIQDHTNNDPTHTPDVTPTLWKVHRTTSGDNPDAWVKPTDSTTAYAENDLVTHPDTENTMGTGADTIWVWRSTYTGNDTEPGKDGQFHRYWEPIERA